MDLKGKRILLGVTGGIAAYKSCELLRLFQKKGAQVRVCMTEGATQFVSSLTFASLSKCPVYLKNGGVESRPFQHIDFPRWADLYVVAPASANTIGKMANGLADDPVSLCFMSCDGPRFIAPAMNVAMYNSPGVKRNLQMLQQFENTYLLEAPAGELACGEVGQGRLLEPNQIVECIEKLPEVECSTVSRLSSSKSVEDVLGSGSEVPDNWKNGLPGNGKMVVITAGRTEESIDPVRYISNRSSGKTAVALASVFLAQGFDVQVVAGPMEASFPNGVKVQHVKSALEMHQAVLSKMNTLNVLVHCAAVADYRPKNVSDQKIKDSRSQLVLELEPNPNILRDSVAARSPGQVVVGFGLETDHFKEHALEKLQKSGADALLLNAPVDSASGFGFDSVKYALIQRDHSSVVVPEMAMGSKIDLATEIVDFAIKKLEGFHG